MQSELYIKWFNEHETVWSLEHLGIMDRFSVFRWCERFFLIRWGGFLLFRLFCVAEKVSCWFVLSYKDFAISLTRLFGFSALPPSPTSMSLWTSCWEFCWKSTELNTWNQLQVSHQPDLSWNNQETLLNCCWNCLYHVILLLNHLK